MANLLVIEDEKRVAELIQKGLSQFGYSIDIALNGDDGIEKYDSNHYDLIICDIMLPTINGFEVSKYIRSKDKTLPILMLSALGETDDKLDGFDSGADDYMVKPFDIRELDARIRVLIKRRGDAQTAPTQCQYKDLILDEQEKVAIRDGLRIKLSPKEYQLLHYMIIHAEKVISRTEIAEQVWDTYFDTGTNFIDVYISYLRNKIDKPFSVKLIHTRPGLGFILTNKS